MTNKGAATRPHGNLSAVVLLQFKTALLMIEANFDVG
jgi:hypothetical protein